MINDGICLNLGRWVWVNEKEREREGENSTGEVPLSLSSFLGVGA